ncbi:uncharacterized protein E0L32_010732 [Thyridium curvatum]|uniref:CCD97-like C-terminal domain-containing protein n=1 Tax=Thyridium curvatum TaxID=1093900 RepID=A0A507AJW1_9PEZI|nr:uncharacterized protein E0L32_010732 [Thyridium curvatum]TPX07633.1 hypothetical protein E0L32_010732 [Thyridium curvatum]
MAPSAVDETASDDLYSRPRPRPQRSPAEAAQVRIRNRRREYLEQNPDYFRSAEHELADPLLYDILIRRFQTPQERQAEGQAKGYARVLEGSLLRGEARLARMAESYASQPTGGGDSSRADPASSSAFRPADIRTHYQYQQPSPTAAAAASQPPSRADFLPAERNPATASAAAQAFAESDDDPPADRAEGQRRWDDFLRERFVHGGDDDFDYAGLVDADDRYDELERRDAEDAWFDDEEPGSP